MASLIVDAELPRTKVTDKGMPAIANFSNLRFLDLSDTAVTSVGAKELMKLEKLESLNLTETRVSRGRDRRTASQARPEATLFIRNPLTLHFDCRENSSCGDSRPRLSAERSSPAAGSIPNSEEMYSKYKFACQSLGDGDPCWNRGLPA